MKKTVKHVIGICLCLLLLIVAGNVIQAEEITILKKENGTEVKTNVKFEGENTIYIPVEYYDDATQGIYYKFQEGVVYRWDDYPDDTNYAEVIAVCPEQEQKTVTIQGCIKAPHGEEIDVVSVNLESVSPNVENLVIQGYGKRMNVCGLWGMFGLKSITMAGDCSKVSFEGGCFTGCIALESIIYENQKSPYVIENGALYYMEENSKNLKSVFDSLLTQYTISEDVTSVDNPFGENSKIKEITINGNLDYLNIVGTVRLREIKISETVDRIDGIYLNGVKKIQNLDFSGVSAKTISVKNAKNLRSISLPTNCVLQREAFYGCKNLRSVTFNDTESVQKIKKNAFKNTRSGIKFYVKNKNVAKSLKKELKKSGVKNAKIYVKKRLVYSGVK